MSGPGQGGLGPGRTALPDQANRLGLLLVLGVGLAARWGPLSESFWIDEVMTADLIDQPLGLLLARAGFGDVHPPGYYLLLKVWSSVFGTGDLGARSLSLVAGLGTVALLYSAVARRAGTAAAIFAGTFLALSTFHVHYSVEARSYALLALASLGLLEAAERWRDTGDRRALALVVACEVLALWTHYYALLIVALVNVHALVAVRSEHATPAWWGASQLVALAGFSPWVPMLLVQLFELPQGFAAHLSDDLPLTWIVASFGPAPCHPWAWLGPLAGSLLVVGLAVGLRAEARESGVEASDTAGPGPAKVPRLLVGVAGAALLVLPMAPFAVMALSDAMLDALVTETPRAYGLLVGLAAAIGAATVLAERRTGRLRLSLPAFVAIGGPLLVLVLHQVRPMLFLRNLLVFLPPVVLVVAVALRGPRWRPVLATLLLVPLALPSLAHSSPSFMPRQDFKGAAALVAEAGETWVLPAWDAPGLQRYQAAGAPDPKAAAHLAELHPEPTTVRLAVVLTRPARNGPPVDEVVGAARAAGFELEARHGLRGHRGGLTVLLFTRSARP